MTERVLELTGVHKAFGGLSVIADLDLHLDDGQIVSVIGPNGAGKTTLFNLITGVYTPDAGDIRVHGASVVGRDPHPSPGWGSRGPSRASGCSST